MTADTYWPICCSGARAKEAMPNVREWMTSNGWLVNIIVLGIFIVLIL